MTGPFDVGGEATDAARYEVSFISPEEVDRTPGFRDEWERCCQSSSHLYVLFQSPTWWDFVQPMEPGERCAVAVVRAGDGSLAGVVPVRTEYYPLSFSIRGRTFLTKRIRSVRVLGSQPILRDNEDLYLAFIRESFREFPECDCVLLAAAEVGSTCWTFVSQSRRLRKHATIYVRRGMTPHHVIAIPSSFDSYLGKFKSKTRYNLRRQVKRLQEHGGGRLELKRIERSQDVRTFLDEAVEVESHSWQHKALGPTLDTNPDNYHKLVRLADLGVLRSYLLRLGDRACAMVKGFQYGGVYYYSWCGFDHRLAELSPGTVLLYLLIEDLCRHRSPSRLTFLEGDAAYKRLFSTNCIEDATVLLTSPRASLSTRLYIRLHAAGKQLASRLRWAERNQSEILTLRDAQESENHGEGQVREGAN